MVQNTIQAITFSVTRILAVALVCGTLVYDCTKSNQQCYAAFNQCVSSGGSAVPTTGNNASGIACIKR